MTSTNNVLAAVVAFFLLSSCSSPSPDYEALTPDAAADGSMHTSATRIAVITGLQSPEAVRYDEESDSYFVANFVGSSRERDANGFILRVNAETGEISPEFFKGTDFDLHAPRGMYVTGDTLWVADADGIHAFDKYSGEQVSFVDLTKFEPRFLNDVAADNDGNLFATDTGGRRLYHVRPDDSGIAADDIGNPNGITFFGANDHFLIAPWEENDPILAWWPQSDSSAVYIDPPGSKIDGIETLGSDVIYAMQSDSTIRLFNGSTSLAIVKTDGKPADIAVDTRRRRVAVPYIALDRVDIWEIPPAE